MELNNVCGSGRTLRSRTRAASVDIELSRRLGTPKLLNEKKEIIANSKTPRGKRAASADPIVETPKSTRKYAATPRTQRRAAATIVEEDDLDMEEYPETFDELSQLEKELDCDSEPAAAKALNAKTPKTKRTSSTGSAKKPPKTPKKTPARKRAQTPRNTGRGTSTIVEVTEDETENCSESCREPSSDVDDETKCVKEPTLNEAENAKSARVDNRKNLGNPVVRVAKTPMKKALPNSRRSSAVKEILETESEMEDLPINSNEDAREVEGVVSNAKTPRGKRLSSVTKTPKPQPKTPAKKRDITPHRATSSINEEPETEEEKLEQSLKLKTKTPIRKRAPTPHTKGRASSIMVDDENSKTRSSSSEELDSSVSSNPKFAERKRKNSNSLNINSRQKHSKKPAKNKSATSTQADSTKEAGSDEDIDVENFVNEDSIRNEHISVTELEEDDAAEKSVNKSKRQKSVTGNREISKMNKSVEEQSLQEQETETVKDPVKLGTRKSNHTKTPAKRPATPYRSASDMDDKDEEYEDSTATSKEADQSQQAKEPAYNTDIKIKSEAEEVKQKEIKVGTNNGTSKTPNVKERKSTKVFKPEANMQENCVEVVDLTSDMEKDDSIKARIKSKLEKIPKIKPMESTVTSAAVNNLEASTHFNNTPAVNEQSSQTSSDRGCLTDDKKGQLESKSKLEQCSNHANKNTRTAELTTFQKLSLEFQQKMDASKAEQMKVSNSSSICTKNAAENPDSKMFSKSSEEIAQQTKASTELTPEINALLNSMETINITTVRGSRLDKDALHPENLNANNLLENQKNLEITASTSKNTPKIMGQPRLSALETLKKLEISRSSTPVPSNVEQLVKFCEERTPSITANSKFDSAKKFQEDFRKSCRKLNLGNESLASQENLSMSQKEQLEQNQALKNNKAEKEMDNYAKQNRTSTNEMRNKKDSLNLEDKLCLNSIDTQDRLVLNVGTVNCTLPIKTPQKVGTTQRNINSFTYGYNDLDEEITENIDYMKEKLVAEFKGKQVLEANKTASNESDKEVNKEANKDADETDCTDDASEGHVDVGQTKAKQNCSALLKSLKNKNKPKALKRLQGRKRSVRDLNLPKPDEVVYQKSVGKFYKLYTPNAFYENVEELCLAAKQATKVLKKIQLEAKETRKMLAATKMHADEIGIHKTSAGFFISTPISPLKEQRNVQNQLCSNCWKTLVVEPEITKVSNKPKQLKQCNKSSLF